MSFIPIGFKSFILILALNIAGAVPTSRPPRPQISLLLGSLPISPSLYEENQNYFTLLSLYSMKYYIAVVFIHLLLMVFDFCVVTVLVG